MKPIIQTTLIGYFPIPTWLAEHPSLANMEDATRVALKIQENAGIDLPVSGEFWRAGIPDSLDLPGLHFYLDQLEGIEPECTNYDPMLFIGRSGYRTIHKASGSVSCDIGEGSLNLPALEQQILGIHRGPVKMTLKGPHTLARSLTNQHYQEISELGMAIATILADQVSLLDSDVIQVEEGLIDLYPEDEDWAIECINLVLDAIRGLPALHYCFPNELLTPHRKAGWDERFEFISGIHCDHILLETSRMNDWDLEPLSDLPDEVGIGLGVLDSWSNHIETADQIAHRLEQAVTILGDTRISWITADCGLWLLNRETIPRKLESLVTGRDRFYGTS
jgi:5-methyltetrahydropteroyltriglutamate--homocysteine methyltransferase